MTSITVLLPAPLGPMRPTTVPSRTVRLQSTTARTPPKLLARPVTSRRAAPSSGTCGRLWRWGLGHLDASVARTRLGDQALGSEAQDEQDQGPDDDVPERGEE